jgi:phosphatidyl-myo-inositol dimannoside synthase
VKQRALLLVPSRGLGGGIERYADTLEWAFTESGIECVRLDLHKAEGGSQRASYLRMLSQSIKHLRVSNVPTRLVIVHRSLLPIASLASIVGTSCGISVICHGNDVWGTRRRVRRAIESHLIGRSSIRVVAVSSFTAGALLRRCNATVLPPGLSQAWFDTLVEESDSASPASTEVKVVTAFRLSQWRAKGLPELLQGLEALGWPNVRLTVCGVGEPPPELRRVLRRYPFCFLRPGLNDRSLAKQLAEADIFVLATRTKRGRNTSGEGFGLVLLEAQVAGTPVIAPAFGGSHDAYIDGVTGVAPTDETAESLTDVLADMLRDRSRLEAMGKRAAEWARDSFAPDRYSSLVVDRLL